MKTTPPSTEKILLERCETLVGLSFNQLSQQLQLPIPSAGVQRKGWGGQAIELALGADAGSKSEPDFTLLGIELKTIPMNAQLKPAESTFITTIPLLTIHQQQWHSSQCYSKLKKILWIPIEGDPAIEYGQRRIGQAVLWSPDEQQEKILAKDWQELTTKIALGQLNQLSSTEGEYLQVRPKAANARSLCYAFDENGVKTLTLPRGFYLRSSFTQMLF